MKNDQIGALIMSPTRELAIQINTVLNSFLEHIPLTSLLIVGGKSKVDTFKKFSEDGGHILISTPGKLAMLLGRGSKTAPVFQKALKSLEVLILDEADRFFQQTNFREALQQILSFLPKQRRTSLFSATQTTEIEAFVRAGLRNPVQVVVREKPKLEDIAGATVKRTPDSLSNFYIMCDADEKLKRLVTLLRAHKEQKFIIFFNTCACVDYFTKLFAILLKNTPVVSIHGQKAKRGEIFTKFQDMEKGILTCTDVMARGIDIPTVDWVIQYDPPTNVEAYVHRCGRTARMGNIGKALLFLLPSENAYIDFVKINQKVHIDQFVDGDDITEDPYSMANKIRKIASRDREIYEKGLRAFVSFIQSYIKHQCSIVLQMKELDIGKLANGFGLLHMPRMPELRDADVTGFVDMEIDTNKIKYTDKAREKARIERKEREALLEGNSVERVAKHQQLKASDSWSKQKEKKQKKVDRKEKKQHNLKRKQQQGVDDGDCDDINDLMAEGRLLKKLKKGKITKEEFEQRVGETLVMDDDSVE